MIEVEALLGGEVVADGNRYRQVAAADLDPTPNGDQCYWCAAYQSMALCDAICPYCNTGFVFIRKTKRGDNDPTLRAAG